MAKTPPADTAFVASFRQSAPYLHAHRGQIVVIAFGGEAVAGPGLPELIHDIALLHSLGIRLVLACGARPQIETRLRERGLEMSYVNGLRVTDSAALECVKEAAGTVRVEIEARLSMGLVNTPMAGARIGVSSGNFVTARPLGIREGTDFQHTGEVRRIDSDGIRQQLEAGRIVLLPPLGYSPTGEVFNLETTEVAASVAVALRAAKLVLFGEQPGLRDGQRRLIRQLDLSQAQAMLAAGRPRDPEMRRRLSALCTALKRGVRRAHLISHHAEGALLLELFTRDGCGTLVSAETYEGLRAAGIDDVGGILELIQPLEEEGVLVRRSRERLEMEIDRFQVLERDGAIIGCAALYPYPTEGLAELACLAVSADYRQGGRGDALLARIEEQARNAGLQQLFVLTTRTVHWFRERGFLPGDLDALPLARRDLYNYQRRSRILIKALHPSR